MVAGGEACRACAAQGLVGLSKSIDKFCVEKGNRFSTYASWWIRQSISRGISERSRVVRLPVHIYEAFARISRVRDELKVRFYPVTSRSQPGLFGYVS